MGKLKILVIPSDRFGVGKFRSIDQHVRLGELYPDNYEITISHDFEFTLEKLSNFDIIHVHKVPYNNFDRGIEIIKLIKRTAATLIIDIDDYWHLSVKHPQYRLFTNGVRTSAIIECIRLADYVSTTTPIAAQMIRKHNKNVIVLPNALNPDEKQMKIINKENNYNIRFGWLGGSNHAEDISLLSGLFNRISELNAQLVLCGFDKNGTKILQNKDTGEETILPMSINETDWYKYELEFTNRYRLVEHDKSYLNYLKSYVQTPYDDTNKPYRRIWTRDTRSYLTGYNEFDVLLSPLCEHEYNKFKSQLKVIEAGFFKKAIIAQDFGPYQLDIVDGKNGLLVEPRKNHKDWFKKAKMLATNPNMVTDLGEALYETVTQKYHIDVVTKQRHEFYQTLKK